MGTDNPYNAIINVFGRFTFTFQELNRTTIPTFFYIALGIILTALALPRVVYHKFIQKLIKLHK